MILAAGGPTLTGCKTRVPIITGPFSDDFERAEPGPNWLDTGGTFEVQKGRLRAKGAKNRPLWLRQRLPRDAEVEIEATAATPQGDLKVELYGDGESYDPDQGQYDPTGYVFVFGGWQNSLSIIGRLGEHDAAVKASRADVKVEPGRTYRFIITRKGGLLDFKIDGQPFLSWTDPKPLEGPGHEHFAITNWEAEATFDNLKIRPAP